MLIIGLTGGIGSGKTTVSDLFRNTGITVIDADEIGRRISSKGQAGYEAIINEFGAELVAENGELDRDTLRDIIFNNDNKRKKLESLLHPLIRNEIKHKLEQHDDEPYCVIAVPLLLETDYRNIVDRILVIDSTEEDQIARVVQRDNLDRDKVKQILVAQLPRSQRLQQADDVIVNDGDISHLATEVAALHKRYLQLAEAVDKIPTP